MDKFVHQFKVEGQWETLIPDFFQKIGILPQTKFPQNVNNFVKLAIFHFFEAVMYNPDNQSIEEDLPLDQKLVPDPSGSNYIELSGKQGEEPFHHEHGEVHFALLQLLVGFWARLLDYFVAQTHERLHLVGQRGEMLTFFMSKRQNEWRKPVVMTMLEKATNVWQGGIWSRRKTIRQVIPCTKPMSLR